MHDILGSLYPSTKSSNTNVRAVIMLILCPFLATDNETLMFPFKNFKSQLLYHLMRTIEFFDSYRLLYMLAVMSIQTV